MIRRVVAEANAVFRPVHESKCRYVAMRGSAGSGKSMDTAQMYILRLMTEPGRNLLCVRKTEESNRASTFAELSAAGEAAWGVTDLWESTAAPLSMRVPVKRKRGAFSRRFRRPAARTPQVNHVFIRETDGRLD